MDIDKVLAPFIGYWNWAQERATWWGKTLAIGAPVVVVAFILYTLFGGGGNGNDLVPGTQQTGDVATQAPQATQPGLSTTPAPSSGATGAAGAPTQPAATAGPAPTAFTQMRYTVEAGDAPSTIAEKVGVPAEIRDAWIQEMLALNGATATTLQVGQELILPPF